MAKLKFRTDLAVENKEMYHEENDVEISGVEIKEDMKDSIKVLEIKITTEAGAESMGKPIGSYVTIEIPKIDEIDDKLKRKCSDTIGAELKKMLPEKKNLNALVVGLGNTKVTPDALGPLTADKITATRHYFLTYKDKMESGVGCVSAITPGVMGDTGVESVDIVKGVVDNIKPDVVIAIDALAARNKDRINTTIQISNTGINPGAGMGNHRKGLNKESLGVEVIAIGVPTVIDSATLIFDTLMGYGVEEFGTEISDHIAGLAVALETEPELAGQFMKDLSGKMIVTVTEVDTIVHEFSNVLANGINDVLHPAMSLSEVHNSFD